MHRKVRGLWPGTIRRIPAAKVILSEKDRHHPCLKDACDWFDYNVNLYE